MDILLYIAIYLVGAGITGAFLHGEEGFVILWCSLFWPITLPIMIGFLLGKIILKVL